MTQNLKKETCNGECYPKYPVYNILQRRIGKWKITHTGTIKAMTRYIQKERCPDGQTLNTTTLNPAKGKYRPYRVW